MTLIGDLGTSYWFKGAFLAPNGAIYSLPFTFNEEILKIDPSDDSSSRISGAPASPIRGWWGGAVATNGVIYGMPYASDKILKFGVPTCS